MRKILLTVSLSLLVLDAVACSSTTEPPNEAQDASAADAQGPDAQPSHDGGGDAQPSHDGSVDGTTADSGPDGTVTDAASDTGPDGFASPGVADADAAIDCPTLIANMLSAQLTPPNKWIGLDLSQGGSADGGAGGLTIDQAGILQCATSVEPAVLDGGAPLQPGLRTATFASPAGSIEVGFNVESRVIAEVSLSAPKSTITFHSRQGGAFGNSNVYVIAFGAGADGGADAGGGYVTKNGQDFAADWKTTFSNGTSHASPWINEIYDGLMATFAPSAPPVVDCLDAPTPAPNGIERRGSCLVVPSIEGTTLLGLRPLGFYLAFGEGTNQAQSTYGFRWSALPSCATPQAATEYRDFLPISGAGNHRTSLGAVWNGVTIGAISAAEPISNAAGLTASEANTIAGCGATTVTARDPGYLAQQWGASGEVELEYNADSGVAYKVFAKQGYKGNLDIVSTADGGATNEYVIAPGTLTNNGAPVTLDWTSDAGTLNEKITDISNAWLADYCDQVDTDCVAAGNCTIEANDGTGHSTFTLLSSPAVATSCGDRHPLTFVFWQGGSVPLEIYTTNPAGK